MRVTRQSPDMLHGDLPGSRIAVTFMVRLVSRSSRACLVIRSSIRSSMSSWPASPVHSLAHLGGAGHGVSGCSTSSLVRSLALLERDLGLPLPPRPWRSRHPRRPRRRPPLLDIVTEVVVLRSSGAPARSSGINDSSRGSKSPPLRGRRECRARAGWRHDRECEGRTAGRRRDCRATSGLTAATTQGSWRGGRAAGFEPEPTDLESVALPIGATALQAPEP